MERLLSPVVGGVSAVSVVSSGLGSARGAAADEAGQVAGLGTANAIPVDVDAFLDDHMLKVSGVLLVVSALVVFCFH